MPRNAPAASGADVSGCGSPPVSPTTANAAENVVASATAAGSSIATTVPRAALSRCHGLAATATGTSLRRRPPAWRRTTMDVMERSVNRATQQASTNAATATTGQTAASPTSATVKASSVPERAACPMRGSGWPGPASRATSPSDGSPSGSGRTGGTACPGQESWSTGRDSRRRGTAGRAGGSATCGPPAGFATGPGTGRASYGSITLVRVGDTAAVARQPAGTPVRRPSPGLPAAYRSSASTTSSACGRRRGSGDSAACSSGARRGSTPRGRPRPRRTRSEDDVHRAAAERRRAGGGEGQRRRPAPPVGGRR